MDLVFSIIKFLIVVVLTPIFLGAFLSHRIFKSENEDSKTGTSLRKIILLGYSFYGGFFVIFDMLALRFGKIGNHREALWKYFCLIITILFIVFEIKYLVDNLVKAFSSSKADKHLWIVIFIVFIVLSIILYHRRYQALTEVCLSGYQNDADIIYDFYACVAGITNLRSARIIYYIYSPLFIVLYFCFYKTFGLFIFSNQKQKSLDSNKQAVTFVYFAALLFLFPVFSDSLDIFGVFVCPWKSETLFASLFSPAIFLAGLYFIKIFSDANAYIKDKIRAALFVFLVSLDAVLCSRAGIILFIFTIILGIIISLINRRFYKADSTGKEETL